MLLAGPLVALLRWLILAIDVGRLITGGLCVDLCMGTLGSCDKLAMKVAILDMMSFECLVCERHHGENIDPKLACSGELLGESSPPLVSEASSQTSQTSRQIFT